MKYIDRVQNEPSPGSAAPPQRSTDTGYEIYAGEVEYKSRHAHFGDRQNWNLLLSLAGRLKLGIGGRELAVGPATLFMIAPGAPRRFAVSEYWKTSWIHFNLDAHIQIPPEWPQIGPGVSAVALNRDDLKELQRLFNELIHVCTIRRHGWYLLAYCLVQEIILRGNMAAHAALGEHIELTAKMLKNLDAPQGIDGIAGKCAMSRTGFFSKFKATFGTTPAKYREQQLLTRVQSYLENSDMSIKEIVQELKLGNPAYLSTRFRKTFGMSPREYRKRHRDGRHG